MSFFNRDLNKEQVLGNYLDEIYLKLKIPFKRNHDVNLQHRGVDLIYNHLGKDFFIDEKAQLDYLNCDLPTFTFELSYLKNNKLKSGWLTDNSKITNYYFLITAINPVNKNDLTKGIINCKILSVNREKLLNYLKSIGLTKTKLDKYNTNIRNSHIKQKKTTIKELNSKTEGCIFYSNHLDEKPINLQLRLKFLIVKNIAKSIYP